MEFDPFVANYAQDRLAAIRTICLAYPEVAEATQFGNPCFKAGKKNFCTLYFRGGRVQISTWAGEEGQAMLTFDKRYRIPAYTGHNGWINMNVHDHTDWQEISAMLENSYRHFALKRMLKALDT